MNGAPASALTIATGSASSSASMPSAQATQPHGTPAIVSTPRVTARIGPVSALPSFSTVAATSGETRGGVPRGLQRFTLTSISSNFESHRPEAGMVPAYLPPTRHTASRPSSQ